MSNQYSNSSKEKERILETFAQSFWQAHDTNVSWAAGDRAVGEIKAKSTNVLLAAKVAQRLTY